MFYPRLLLHSFDSSSVSCALLAVHLPTDMSDPPDGCSADPPPEPPEPPPSPPQSPLPALEPIAAEDVAGRAEKQFVLISPNIVLVPYLRVHVPTYHGAFLF